MRKGQWLQIMLDKETLKFDFDGTFTLQYRAEVLSNKTTPQISREKRTPALQTRLKTATKT